MLDRAGLGACDRAQAVDRLTERVDRAAQHGVTYRHIGRTAGALDLGALMQAGCAAQQDNADALARQVEHDAAHAGLKLDELAVDRAVQAIDRGNAVADFQHRAGLLTAGTVIILFDFLPQDGNDFIRMVQWFHPFCRLCAKARSCPRTL